MQLTFYAKFLLLKHITSFSSSVGLGEELTTESYQSGKQGGQEQHWFPGRIGEPRLITTQGRRALHIPEIITPITSNVAELRKSLARSVRREKRAKLE